MKYCYNISFALALLTAAAISCKKNNPPPSPDNPGSFKVTASNGYGSGEYTSGDTVHVFSKEYSANQLFGSWTGTDVSLLNAPNEWHTWFIMPERDVAITGNVITPASFTLKYEEVQGKLRAKPVYYFFPDNHKGIVYLLHGTSGSAANLVASYEWMELIKDLVNDHFAVIITESEEATANADLNNDGSLRWNNLPWDTDKNVDFANIKIITSNFYDRKLTDAGKPRYSIGMSNGGNFSTALATLYNFKAGVSYCAPSGNNIAQTTTTPIQFCMARFDNNSSVGPVGNANALDNSKTMTGRGICSRYFINERSPLYPERFARTGEINLALSAEIFNELKAQHLIDDKNYFIGTADDLIAAYSASPASFPKINSLSFSQKIVVTGQVGLAVSDHKMYSDYNRATLKFLNRQCR